MNGVLSQKSEYQSTASKINLLVKNTIHEREPDLTSVNQLMYASAVKHKTVRCKN